MAGVPVEETFAPVTVIPGSQIVSRPGATLSDLIQGEPGLSGSAFAPGANRPIIRGLDNNRVRVQENGVGTHDVSALSEDHGVPIDPLVADQIEVVRGPATLRYGSQAIGGVVSAINQRIPETIPRNGISYRVIGGFNTADRGSDGAFSVTTGAGPVALHADAFKRSADDYRTPLGRQGNSFVESEGYSVGGSLVGAKGFIGLALSQHDSDYGIPGGRAAERRTHIDMERTQLTSRGELRVREGGIDAIRYWFANTRYKHDEISTTDGETKIGSTFVNREREGRAEVQHMPVATAFGELRGAVGTSFGWRNLSAGGEGNELLAPNRTRTAATYLFEELQITQRLRLQGAVRAEHARVAGTGHDTSAGLLPGAEVEGISADRRFSLTSMSAGILYELPLGIVARVTGASVERAPDAAELFSKGPHEATGTFEIANPGLTKERAETIELGLRRTAGSFRFDASLFQTRFHGFIFKQLTGNTCGDSIDTCKAVAFGQDGAEELKQINIVQRDAMFRGVELQGELDVVPVWRGVIGVDGRYDMVHAFFDDSRAGSIPRIPPHRVGAGVYYRDANWRARVGVLHALAQRSIGEGETATSGYSLLSADVSYRFLTDLPGRPEMVVGIRGDNLLDDEVRHHTSFKKDEVLQPGRTIRLYGSVKLN